MQCSFKTPAAATVMALWLAAACAGEAADAGLAPLPAGLTLPPGFTGVVIANVPRARELAIAPNGDLFVGTEGSDVCVVTRADAAGAAAPARVFWRHPAYDNTGDAPNAGVAFSLAERALYVGANTSVWMLAYRPGVKHPLSARKIVRVRTGRISPGNDGDVHETTSVAFSRGSLYVSVGSSCNVCAEVDATRAVVLEFPATGGRPLTKATRIRNAIALTVNPSSGHVWIGDAGQDDLPFGHPYEFADDLSAHPGRADYGWPDCEEHHVAYVGGARCESVVVPLVELPAYSTIIGATFYPHNERGKFAFPKRYRGALFLAAHGSWHRRPDGAYAAAPQVVYVPMRGDRPVTPVDWADPDVQWRTFLSGFQQHGTARIGRPTGVTIGPEGSLFIADDQTGNIYRIRPTP